MIGQLIKQFRMGQTDDDLLQDFHQLSQGPCELVQDFGAKLECQFHRLQERFPGRYIPAQLKERFFHRMHKKLRDSMRFMCTKPDLTFGQLLEASMLAKKELTPRSTVGAKAVTSEVPITNDLGTIQNLLDALNQYLKGANFKGTSSQPTAESQGPVPTATGPFKPNEELVQCYKCWGWGTDPNSVVIILG